MDNSQEKERKTTKSRQQRAPRERWNERVVQISRVTKVCKGGKKLSFRAVVIIGNENGQVGVGVGKAEDVINAITKTSTVPHLNYGTFGACRVLIKPASQGTGVIAGSSIKTVLELAGIKNILAKQLGGNNQLNNARATICALQTLKTPAMVAKERNLPLEKFYS